MLYEVLKYIKCFYVKDHVDGTIKIENGSVSLPFVANYVLIEGSMFNDGVYTLPLSNLTNEIFNGRISAVAPPKELLSLVDEIEAWEASNEPSVYTSESFGGYSRTRATNANGGAAGWQDVFKDRLKVWKKI